MIRKITLFACLFLGWLLSSCLKNDIPYPIIEAKITDIATDNMLETPKIDATNRTVSITVGDSVDLHKLRLTRLLFTEQATVSVPDSALLSSFYHFPHSPFASLNELPKNADTRVNMSKPYTLKLTTYQDYKWTVQVNQVIEREVKVQGQVGSAVIDTSEHIVIIYVNGNTSPDKVKVEKFTLGGPHGKVVPNPCDDKYAGGYDFDSPQSFFVQHAWEETFTQWRVYVYTAPGAVAVTTDAFARTVSATVSASDLPSNVTLQYKAENASDWVSVTNFTTQGKKTKAEITGLTPATTYAYKWCQEKADLANGSFTTTEATPLTDGSLDNWHQASKTWNPWAEGGTSYWDTGNKGATTVGDSNSVPTDESSTGKGKAACLQSKYIVMKFAAGNLFTGTYVKTDGTNGVLDFGRPFTAFPTKLRFNYKYHSEPINRVGDESLQHLKGKPDECSIYIILADWDKPFTIRTRKSERSLIDPVNDEHVLAYSELSTSESNDQYKTYELPINYKVTNRRPTYIVVVASASKYGDYFTGGEGSCLWIDNFELVYE